MAVARATRLMLIVVIGSTLTMSACGGGGADYYESLQAASDRVEDDYVALSLDAKTRLDSVSFAPVGGWDPDVARCAEQLLAELGNPSHFTTEAVDVDLMVFRDLRAIFVDADAGMDDVEPHAEVVALHAEIHSVLREWSDLLGLIINELETAQSSADLMERLGTLDLSARFDALHDRLDSTCVELQSAARRDASSVQFGSTWADGPSGEASSVNLLCG